MIKTIKWSSIISVVLFIAVVALSVLLYTGCFSRTFKPIWIKELPKECNMTLNTYRMHYNSKDKSGAIPSSNFCFKKLHREDCMQQYFPGKPVDYNDLKNYRNYEQCRSELK